MVDAVEVIGCDFFVRSWSESSDSDEDEDDDDEEEEDDDKLFLLDLLSSPLRSALDFFETADSIERFDPLEDSSSSKSIDFFELEMKITTS